jgi:hypothetical protein
VRVEEKGVEAGVAAGVEVTLLEEEEKGVDR